MRILFFIACLAVVGLVVTGAIHLKKTDNSIMIEVDKQRVAEDAREVIEEGKELLHEAEARLHEDNQRN